MALARKTGKPKALEEDEAQHEEPDQDLAGFLREMHGESLESADDTNQERAEDDPNKLPSLGWLKDHFKTKSATIRYLTIERKFPVAQVAKHLGVKYQHVRNVTRQILKRGPNESFHLADGQKVSSVKTDD